jgi:hypothetical protein
MLGAAADSCLAVSTVYVSVCVFGCVYLGVCVCVCGGVGGTSFHTGRMM